MQVSFRECLVCAAAVVAITGFATRSEADGRIDASTLVAASHGTFNGVQYKRYEAMFEGATSNGRPYRVPCQIIAPQNSNQGSGLLLFDWLVPSTIPTAVGQEQADAPYTLTDDFLFGLSLTYATVRCDPAGIGRRSSIPDASRPWSDGLLNTSSEFITSAGDEFDIVVDFVKALKTDPVAAQLTGPIIGRRRSATRPRASGSVGCSGSRWVWACSTSRSSGEPATDTPIRRGTRWGTQTRKEHRWPERVWKSTSNRSST
jgi:hypothetical protein